MLGKTYLVALYCVVRCILYPGTTVCVAAGYKGQSIEVIQKITEDFMKKHKCGSAILRAEIKSFSTSVNNAYVEFRNTSIIKVVTADDSARHNRANIIVCDEFRMINKKTIDTVLKRFLTAPRQPGYLKNPKYTHLLERNIEMYMSSAWYKDHWSYEKLQSYYAAMLDDTKKYFCCGLPYQIAIREGLLFREAVEDEMSEADFDPVSFRMEMGCEWIGDTDGAFFKFNDISPRRKLKKAFYPLEVYRNHQIRIPDLEPNEIRLLSVDVALMATKKHKNDAAALTINSAIPTEKNDYISNIVYIETHEGLLTDELGILIMRLFYQFHCTYLVLDCTGVGLPIFDYISKQQYDTEYGVSYEAMTCINNEEMAARCKIKNANKVVWSIKADAKQNSLMATALRAGFQNGSINLLIHEIEADNYIKKIRGYSKMTPKEQAALKLPYIQTSLLINEMVNLDHEINGTNIKIKEKTGMRKDRFSSLEYNYWVCREVTAKQKPKSQNTENIIKKLPIRAGKRYSLFDNGRNGRKRKRR